MKSLRLLLAIAITSISIATAAEEEKLPDWMNIEVQIDAMKAKPRPETVADHVALVKAAIKQKTELPVELEFSKKTLACPVSMSTELSDAKKGISVRAYLETVVQRAQERDASSRPAWEKAGEHGVRFVDLYARTFKIYVEQQRKLEKSTKDDILTVELLEQRLKEQSTPISRFCKIIWKREHRIIVMEGLPADLKAMEKLLKLTGWRGD